MCIAAPICKKLNDIVYWDFRTFIFCPLLDFCAILCLFVLPDHIHVRFEKQFSAFLSCNFFKMQFSNDSFSGI
jgi:hypothetical protein